MDYYLDQFAEFYRLKEALASKLDDKPAKILKRLPPVYFIVKGKHMKEVMVAFLVAYWITSAVETFDTSKCTTQLLSREIKRHLVYGKRLTKICILPKI